MCKCRFDCICIFSGSDRACLQRLLKISPEYLFSPPPLSGSALTRPNRRDRRWLLTGQTLPSKRTQHSNGSPHQTEGNPPQTFQRDYLSQHNTPPQTRLRSIIAYTLGLHIDCHTENCRFTLLSTNGILHTHKKHPNMSILIPQPASS